MRAASRRAAAGLTSLAAERPPYGEWHPDDLPSFIHMTDKQLEVWIRREQDYMTIPQIARAVGRKGTRVWVAIQNMRKMGLKISSHPEDSRWA
jgi:biotin operon repressor